MVIRFLRASLSRRVDKWLQVLDGEVPRPSGRITHAA